MCPSGIKKALCINGLLMQSYKDKKVIDEREIIL